VGAQGLEPWTLGQKQIFALQSLCPLYPRKRTLIDRCRMSACANRRHTTNPFDHLSGSVSPLSHQGALAGDQLCAIVALSR
jgi:hypothetical protein